MEDLDLVFCGSQVLIKQVADETSCMSYSLLNWFGQDVYYGSPNALFFLYFSTQNLSNDYTKEKKGIYVGFSYKRLLYRDTIFL